MAHDIARRSIVNIASVGIEELRQNASVKYETVNLTTVPKYPEL
jgi:hypothetical protein